MRYPSWSATKTKTTFGAYDVLSARELESRYDVFVEQYVVKVNIEAETAASIARTMLLPASLRHLTELRAAGIETLVGRDRDVSSSTLIDAILELEKANATTRRSRASRLAIYMRDTVIPAMDATRAAADALERIVADDLWPLPKYQEMLFIK